MLIILPHKQLEEKIEKKLVEGESKAEKPADWAFMEESDETLTHMPATWSAYPKDSRGMADIINMEHTEFQEAFSNNMAKEDQMRELVHLASACLYYWRYLNAQ